MSTNAEARWRTFFASLVSFEKSPYLNSCGVILVELSIDPLCHSCSIVRDVIRVVVKVVELVLCGNFLYNLAK